ncbi:DUF1641 domain-containing protein [Phocicoccus pinnipedialis]|uniref:DUF1641 domain-containing protein n=1 Tax=Phocicoccus pinnipedialis TaxID=110845 RepID=A0A6V7R3Z2_9BACL|nr:DUF1641 domain-containing protein [Jeotgalicoccus pinnipedialis]MBP1940006.1 uncharacterized protein YjgD (DUF1641 family) [Jeotgalicoccus pinnipedialis]CAD2072046.1 hypothetical protein JEOPIN946_00244 [Jeotgalicoccus pinnipedialis]
MAKATTKIRRMEVDPEEVRRKELRELEDQLIAHKDTLNNLFRLLDQLEEHEVLNAANAGLAHSDQILTRVLKALGETETDKSIRNALLLVQGLAKFNFEDIEPIILKVNKGLLAKEERTGVAGLFKTLISPEFIEGMNYLLNFVKGFGTPVDQLKEEQGIKDAVHTDAGEIRKMQNYPTSPSSSSNGIKYLGLAGAAVITVGALFLRK